MSYFSQHYGLFSYPVATGGAEADGLRLAQIGAIHAVAAHFVTRSRPAIIVMPTGTGKTAVLTALPFVLRAKRVLVIVPSRLLRDQTSKEFGKLAVLREVGALPSVSDLAHPKVKTVRKRLTQTADWEDLRSYDVVVSTPSSASPAHSGVAPPPADLFDLVLVDEAHHEPASTWRSLVSAFTAQSVLCSATPFRRDAREIRGSVVFDYPLRQARDDGIFSSIHYVPTPGSDREIALEVARLLAVDRSAGLKHHALIRTDRRKRAEELLRIYESVTNLRLEVLHGGMAGKSAEAVLNRVRADALDGILAVNMMGEGIDLPTLKVAGLHAPYKSLAATLQFVGRLTRTNASVGPAKLVANPSDLEIEAERLYAADAVWSDLVPTLLADRVNAEVRIKQQLDTFTQHNEEDPDDSLVSLYALAPYFHIKAFHAENLDLSRDIAPPRGESIISSSYSEELGTRIIASSRRTRPRWIRDSELTDLTHNLHILISPGDDGLLFICTTNRTESTYKHLALQACDGFRDVSFHQIKRALSELEKPRFTSVGMRNSLGGTSIESYRMLAGRSAEQGIRIGDERVYGLGHAFGIGDNCSLGVSTLSKIWSHQVRRLPDLVGWCARLAARLRDEVSHSVNDRIDSLGVPAEAISCSERVFLIDWHEDTWKSSPTFPGRDFSLAAATPVVRTANEHAVDFTIQTDAEPVRVTYDPTAPNTRHFTVESPSNDVILLRDGEELSLTSYLADHPPRFHVIEGGYFEGSQWLSPRTVTRSSFGRERLEDWIWDGVDIQKEAKASADSDLINIHTAVQNTLQEKCSAPFIYTDDGSGELADIVTIHENGVAVVVDLYHCKYSSAADPGARVADLYEVCGQAIKSARRRSKEYVVAHLRRRFKPERAVRGGIGDLDRLAELLFPWQFRIVLVQPGVSKSRVSDFMLEVLAGTDVYLAGQAFEPLRLVCSS